MIKEKNLGRSGQTTQNLIRGMEDPVFKDNILYLAAQAPRLDLFFTPTFGGDIDTIRALKPKVVFPMDDGGNERQYAKFAQKLKALSLDVEIGAAQKPGAQFLYSNGKLRSYYSASAIVKGLMLAAYLPIGL